MTSQPHYLFVKKRWPSASLNSTQNKKLKYLRQTNQLLSQDNQRLQEDNQRLQAINDRMLRSLTLWTEGKSQLVAAYHLAETTQNYAQLMLALKVVFNLDQQHAQNF